MAKKKLVAVDPLEASLGALTAKAENVLLHELRFPNYRNLEGNTRLHFAFPVTALLGCNGTNKSSLLHAAYGSLHGRSVSEFWFETKLDAIPDVRDGLKQSVTHKYRDSDASSPTRGKLVECIKARAPRGTRDPDYWETVKPTMPYGFAADSERIPPLKAEVCFVDCRAELPAFDKYFHFPDEHHLNGLIRNARASKRLRRDYRKQDYLRRKSGIVLKSLEQHGKDLTPEELTVLSHILDRSYLCGRYTSHSHYRGHSGLTLKLTTNNLSDGYTDAFAGSGEYAAMWLVHKLIAAPANSLFLLDEPETSLYPRAQRRMLQVICHYAVRNSLQVIMATHSPYFTEQLHQSAIRVLYLNSQGSVSVSSAHTAREALHEVADLPPGKVVLVEDDRAKHILLSALRAWRPGAGREINIVVRPGGTSRIFADIQAHAAAGRTDLLVVLDGDHRFRCEIAVDDELPSGKAPLTRLMRELTRGPNAAGPALPFATAEEVRQYIAFLRDNVRFLPGDTPESLVWSDTTLHRVFGAVDKDVTAEPDCKKKLRLFASSQAGMTDEAVFHLLTADVIRTNSVKQKELRKLVDFLSGAAITP